MKKLYRNIDRETVFFEDEVKKATDYFGVTGECETLEDVADEWNNEHCFDGIGELIVSE